MNSPNAYVNDSSKSAPWFNIPDVSITSIEHPCIVKNNQKGLDMLGGPRAIAQNLQAGTEKALSLNFRPNNPSSRSVLSLHHDTNNVLLKVTVPKRTGRKRKRGSTDEFHQDDSPVATRLDASYLLKSMADNADRYTVEAVGDIKSTHMWRQIPDLNWSTQGSQFMKGIESTFLDQDYPALKQWTLPRTYGLTDTEAPPPPVFSTQTLISNYMYRQNPAVKAFSDPTTGKKKLHNMSAPKRVFTYQCQYDTVEYPTKPMPHCPPLQDQISNVQNLVTTMQALFAQRPLWTRRALINSLPEGAPIFNLNQALGYLAFAVRSGPWRDTYCAYGVDPRTDPKYRKYQTVLLQLIPRGNKITQTQARETYSRKWTRGEDVESHIFTGLKPVPPDGKVWQLLDLEDPQLKTLVDIDDKYIRAQCETRYFGWYLNGTNAKIRVGLKAKVDALTEGAPMEPEVMTTFLRFPEEWDGVATSDVTLEDSAVHLHKSVGRKQLEWASAYRNICRIAGGTMPLEGPNSSRQGEKLSKGRLGTSGSNDRGDRGSVVTSTASTIVDADRRVNGQVGEPGDDDDDEQLAANYVEPEEGDQDMEEEDEEVEEEADEEDE